VANLKASLQQAADDARASTVRWHFQPKFHLRRLTSNDRVGTSDGGNDVLDDPLRQTPSDTFDPVLLGTISCLLVQPLDVVRVVVVELLVWRADISMISKMLTECGEWKSPTFERLWPFEYARPFDAVFGKSWSIGDGADREHRRRCQHVHLPHRELVISPDVRHSGYGYRLTEHS
jgi:hypothetical protein